MSLLAKNYGVCELELVPRCPFCGSEKVVLDRLAEAQPVLNYCVCRDCGATGPIKNDADEAVIGWGTRFPD